MAALKDGANELNTPWEITSRHFFDDVERLRWLMSTIFNAPSSTHSTQAHKLLNQKTLDTLKQCMDLPSDIAVIPAVSFGFGQIYSALESLGKLKDGTKILFLEHAFPATTLIWKESRYNFETITVPSPTNGDWTTATLETISKHPDIDIVICPHVHWTDGCIIQAAKVRAAVPNAIFIMDVTQSVGVIPFPLQDIKPDFVVAATYKWLLGPYQLAFMYVDPKWWNGKPVELGQRTRATALDFSNTEYCPNFLVGARRFDGGENENFVTLPFARVALEQMIEWGAPRILATLKGMTTEITEFGCALGLTVVDSKFQGGHMVGLRFPGGAEQCEKAVAYLRQDGVYVSRRGDSMRVAPHVYNTAADVNKFCFALQRAMREVKSSRL
eukprot:TRINITY_DN74722_c0_g1_i1.p1 TRINITY_DN74722_c0_g1~~TRINITY_DN74722_c0_g1_i1.p1  ORF type:complete len:444 (+),score=27.73 TRINITY_DN74722_c0_g1_i1:180-1334(+)